MKITVFGGGNVALRKCKYFQGADITVIAENVLPEIYDIAKEVRIEKIPEDIEPLIDRSEVVIAATDSKALNDKIRDCAFYYGIHSNSAHGGGTILIPSVLKRKNYAVAVSSEGRVPAFPPYVVRVLDSILDERYDRVVDLLMDLRAISKIKIDDQHSRRLFLESVLSDNEIMQLVADDRMQEAKQAALKKGGMI